LTRIHDRVDQRFDGMALLDVGAADVALGTGPACARNPWLRRLMAACAALLSRALGSRSDCRIG